MNDNLVVISLSKDALVDAYGAVVQMAEIFPAYLKKINFEGQGEQDAKDCKSHLLIAANACLTVINLIDGADIKAKEADHEQS
jgi:hypothetical protein